MTRRTLNWKFLLITIMSGGALAATLYVVHGWQLGRTANNLLIFAQNHDRKEEWLKSAEYLDRYLRVKPNDIQTKIRLAQTYAKGADVAPQKARAIDLHYRALSAGDKKSEVELRCDLAQLLLDLELLSSTDRSNEAERQAALVLKDNANHPEANRLMAIAINRQFNRGAYSGQPLQTLAILTTTERARQLNPDDLDLVTLNAALLRDATEVVKAERPEWTAARREQEADECLDQYIAGHPQSAEARLARFRYRNKYKLAGADADLEAALSLEPAKADNRIEVVFTAAISALDQARRKQQAAADAGVVRTLFEESAGHFEQLIPLLKGGQLPEAHLGLGECRLGLKDLEGALKAWRDGIARAKEFAASSLTTQAEYHGRIADACLTYDRLTDAEAALNEVDSLLTRIGQTVPQQQFRTFEQVHGLRRARWHVQRRAFAAALPVLRSVMAVQGTGEQGAQAAFQANFLAGMVYAEMGQWNEAAAAYERAANLRPLVAETQLAAANAWIRGGRADVARDRAEKAHSIKPSRDTWFAIAGAELLLQRGRPVEDRDFARLEEALRALASSPPLSSTPARPGVVETTTAPWRVAFLQADLAMLKAQPDIKVSAERAAEVLRVAEEKFAEETGFLRQLCLVYQGLELDEEADRVLAKLRSADPQSLENSLTQARILSLRSDEAGATKVLQQAMLSAPPAMRDRLQADLLRSFLAAKNWDEARGLLAKTLERDPQNLSILRRLAEVDLERNDMPAVERWEQRLATQGPVGESLAGYFRAWRLFRASKEPQAPELRSALVELEKVTLAQPTWADASALKGMTLQRLGRFDEAVKDYERAVQNGDRRVLVLEQLVALLDRLERPADVEKYLAQMESQAPLTQWATEFASNHEIRQERPGRAIELARKRAEQQPDDAAAQLWLGRLLMMANESDEAAAALELATALAPANLQTWETLITLYSRVNQQEKLQATLQRLQDTSSLAAGRKYLLLGRTYQAMNDLPAAERTFLQAATEDENDVATRIQVAQYFLRTDPARAKPHLEVALRLAPDSPAARQLLAIAQAATGEMAQAEKLLSSLGEGEAALAENVRLHALLLVQQGGASNLTRATNLLEDLLERKQGSQPVDRLLLARLYEQQISTAADDDLEKQHVAKAEKHLTALAGVSEAPPAHLATAAQFCLRHGRKEQAAEWLNKLESRVDVLDSDDPSTIALVIETQLQQRDFERTASWLARLKKLEPKSLRPIALECRVAIAKDANAKVEQVIEPQAKAALAAATTPEQRQQIFASVAGLYREFNRLPAAEQWYRQLHGESPQQYAGLVGVLAAQRKVTEAIALCEAAAKTDETAQPALILASTLVEATASDDDYQRAQQLLKNAVQRHEDNQNLLYTVALVNILRNSSAEAIPLLRKVVALNGRNVPALNNLALLLADSPEHREEAVRLIDDAINVAGPSAGLLDSKGSILVYSGRAAEAIEPLQAATRDPQADPRHHFHLAIAYYETGRAADAKRHMQIAMDRQLGTQVLTATDRELLAKLLGNLKMERPISTTAVIR